MSMSVLPPETPLQAAVANRDPAEVRALVNGGENVLEQNSVGETAVHHAI